MPTLQFSEGSSLPPAPNLHRKQLLNNIVDGLAAVRPESVWAKVPKDDRSYDTGFRRITYKKMANAVNGVAQWLVNNMGASTSFETLAYFGPWDPRYIVILLGAVKAGFKMVFPSPTYPAAGLSQLLQRLRCAKILVSSKGMVVVSDLSRHMAVDVYEVPSLNELLDIEYPHYSYEKKFESARSDPLVVVHTSGTTGTPKPLIITHDWAASWIQQNQWPAPEGYASREHIVHGIELCAISPPNHQSSFFPHLFGAVANQMVVLYPTPDAPFTIETTMALIRGNDPDLLIAPAFILDRLAGSDSLVSEVSAKVSMIGFGGGPLSKNTGDILTRHFRVFGLYGTSELGLVHKIAPAGPWDAKAWNSIMPHPKDNIQFRPIGDSTRASAHEAVLIRNSSAEDEQPVFKLFPELQEWSTKDTFLPDPDRKGFWIYEGRLDDIIILSGGQTVNPVGFEQRVASHPLVTAAIMLGSGKSQPTLIVQMQDPTPNGEESSTIDKVWPMIEECNSLFPPEAKIDRSHVVITATEKALPRSPKGSVQRVAAQELYQSEVDGLY